MKKLPQTSQSKEVKKMLFIDHKYIERNSGSEYVLMPRKLRTTQPRSLVRNLLFWYIRYYCGKHTNMDTIAK